MTSQKTYSDHVTMNTIRINKYLSDKGVCSRREADRMLAEGRIKVNGMPAAPGTKISGAEEILLDDQPIRKQEEKVLLLFNKPRGIVCSTRQQRDEVTVTDYIDYKTRIYPIGRLDKDSEGLLLMTNQGDLVNGIMKASTFHEKEYVVEVNRPITDEFLRGMAGGVPILGTMTRKCKVWKIGRKTFGIVLTQGLNRQIRRMCEYFGYRVVSLKRVRIMNFQLDDLEEGAYRKATAREMSELKKTLESKTLKGDEHAGINKDKRAGRNSESCVKGVLPERQRNHEQSGVRQDVRRTHRTGEKNRNHSGRQSNGKRRV